MPTPILVVLSVSAALVLVSAVGIGAGLLRAALQEPREAPAGRRPTHEMEFICDRGGDYAAAIGLARLALNEGDAERAKRVLDRAVDVSHAKHRAACLADGHDPELVERFLPTKPTTTPEGDLS